MKLTLLRVLALATALVIGAPLARAQYATGLVNYTPGTGIAAEFGTGLLYNQTSAVLGEPSRFVPGDFGGPVDPFAPPYTRDQLLSIGIGGSLTVSFAAPIRNAAANPFGLDFQVFGGAGFIVTNDFDADFNFIGTPATDGSLFGAQTGSTRVSVSADGLTYYTLNPGFAPNLEGFYPSDGQGQFGVPVDPALTGFSFAGKSLAEIRALYAGSGGGVGYDLAWAQDDKGQSVTLSEISFVRLDVLSGRAEIDGLSAVASVPEPAPWALLGLGFGLLLCGRRQRSENLPR
jgi:hypothetical protein